MNIIHTNTMDNSVYSD